MNILKVEHDNNFPPSSEVSEQLRVTFLAIEDDFLEHTIIVDETGIGMISKDLDGNTLIFDGGKILDTKLNCIYDQRPDLKNKITKLLI